MIVLYQSILTMPNSPALTITITMPNCALPAYLCLLIIPTYMPCFASFLTILSYARHAISNKLAISNRCYVTSLFRLHYKLCYLVLKDATSCYAMPCYVITCYAVLCYAVPCYAYMFAALCPAMLCYAMLRHYIPLYAMRCCGIQSYAMLLHPILCCGMLTMLCRIPSGRSIRDTIILIKT